MGVGQGLVKVQLSQVSCLLSPSPDPCHLGMLCQQCLGCVCGNKTAGLG